MGFELIVRESSILTNENNIMKVATEFLIQIGYLEKGNYEIPLKLFVECFLKNREKYWQVSDLAAYLGTTPPTIYRYLNKLKNMDLIEEKIIDYKKKGYKLRYGNLAKAWNFTETHAKYALENYRQTIEHLQQLAEKCI